MTKVNKLKLKRNGMVKKHELPLLKHQINL